MSKILYLCCVWAKDKKVRCMSRDGRLSSSFRGGDGTCARLVYLARTRKSQTLARLT